jgi:hypothetical protein
MNLSDFFRRPRRPGMGMDTTQGYSLGDFAPPGGSTVPPGIGEPMEMAAPPTMGTAPSPPPLDPAATFGNSWSQGLGGANMGRFGISPPSSGPKDEQSSAVPQFGMSSNQGFGLKDDGNRQGFGNGIGQGYGLNDTPTPMTGGGDMVYDFITGRMKKRGM